MKKVCIIQMLTIGLFLLIASAPLLAANTVVFKDNFENVTAVTWPNLTTDADPLAQSGAWDIYEQRDAGNVLQDVQVCNNTVPGPVQGSNYLVVNRVVAAWVRANLGAPVADANLTISFDMYVVGITDSNEDATNNGMNIWARNNSQQDVISDTFRANGTITHLNAAGFEGSIGNFTTNAWHQVTYTMNLAHATYDLKIDDVTYPGLDFSYNRNEIADITFYGTWHRTTFYLDDVVMTTDGTFGLPANYTAELFKDNFENVTAVAWPNTSVDADPIAQKGVWAELYEQFGGHVVNEEIQVTNNASPGPAEGANYLVVRRREGTSIWGNFRAPADANVVGAEFDLYVVGGSSNDGADIVFRNNYGTLTFTDTVIEDWFRASGALSHYTGGSSQVIGNFPTDQWLRIRYLLNMSAHTYDLFVGSATWSRTWKNLAFDYNVNQIEQIVFYPAYTATTIYLDDLSVKMPGAICLGKPLEDMNGDCKVDFADMAYLATNWLKSNLH